MKTIRDNFVLKYQEHAKKWESCTDDRRVFVNCYNMILFGLDEMIENDMQSIVVIVGFEKEIDMMTKTMDAILAKFKD